MKLSESLEKLVTDVKRINEKYESLLESALPGSSQMGQEVEERITQKQQQIIDKIAYIAEITLQPGYQKSVVSTFHQR
jgi:archaellum component FlaC